MSIYYVRATDLRTGPAKSNKYSEQREFIVMAISSNSVYCVFVLSYFN